MDRKTEKAQSHEDKHTSECKEAYDVGFAEKCAEFGIDPEELVSYMEKAAQGTVPTNPATEPGYGLGNYNFGSYGDYQKRQKNPYDDPNYKPTNPSTEAEDENYGIESPWSAYGMWGANVGNLAKGIKNIVNPDDLSWEEWKNVPIQAAKSSWHNLGAGLYNATIGYGLGPGGKMNYQDIEGEEYTPGEGFMPSAHQGYVPQEKKMITYDKWKSYNPQQQANLAEQGVTYDPQSEVDYQQNQMDNFRKGLLASGYSLK